MKASFGTLDVLLENLWDLRQVWKMKRGLCVCVGYLQNVLIQFLRNTQAHCMSMYSMHYESALKHRTMYIVGPAINNTTFEVNN